MSTDLEDDVEFSASESMEDIPELKVETNSSFWLGEVKAQFVNAVKSCALFQGEEYIVQTIGSFSWLFADIYDTQHIPLLVTHCFLQPSLLKSSLPTNITLPYLQQMWLPALKTLDLTFQTSGSSLLSFPPVVETILLSSTCWNIKELEFVEHLVLSCRNREWPGFRFPPNLQSLALPKVSCAFDLTYLPQLTSLNLHLAYLGKENAWPSFKFPPNLEQLHLSCSDFCADISHLKKLHTVCMTNVRVEDWSKVRLPVSVKKLDLSHSTWHGLVLPPKLEHLRAVRVKLRSWPALPDTLRTLDLYMTDFHHSLKHTQLTSLILRCAKPRGPSGWLKLELPDSLKFIDLAETRNIHVVDFTKLPSLHHIILDGVRMKHWRLFGFPPQLRTLSLRWSDFDAPLDGIELHFLDLHRVRLQDWTQTKLPISLITLVLSGSNFDQDLSDLLFLENLDMSFVHLASWRAVLFPVHLRKLCLSHSNVPLAILRFERLRLLKRLSLVGVRLRDWELIRFPDGLQYLDLSRTNFRGTFYYLTKLKELKLIGVWMKIWGISMFPAQLKTLDLSCTNCSLKEESLKLQCENLTLTYPDFANDQCWGEQTIF